MEREVLAIFVGGIIGITLGSFSTFKKGFAEGYVRNTGRGFIWKKLLGEEHAIIAVRKVFGPLALVIGVALIVWGLVVLVAA